MSGYVCVSMAMHVPAYVCVIFIGICICLCMWHVCIHMYDVCPGASVWTTHGHTCKYVRLVCACFGCTWVYCREGWVSRQESVCVSISVSNFPAHLIVSTVCPGEQPPSRHLRGLLRRGPLRRELPVRAPRGVCAGSAQSG